MCHSSRIVVYRLSVRTSAMVARMRVVGARVVGVLLSGRGLEALVGIFILDVRRQVTSLGGGATPRDGPISGGSGDRRRIPLSVHPVRTGVVPRLGHLPATACRCVL